MYKEGDLFHFYIEWHLYKSVRKQYPHKLNIINSSKNNFIYIFEGLTPEKINQLFYNIIAVLRSLL